MRERITHPDARVRAVLAAAAAPAERPVPGEAEALAAFRAVMAADRPRSSMHRTTKLAAAAALSVLTLSAGGYAMASTTLPEQAADQARAALAAVGLVEEKSSGPSEKAGDHPADAATTQTGGTAPATTADSADPAANDHGQAVKAAAQDDAYEGQDKGEYVSGVASSKASTQRQDGTHASTTRDTAGDTAGTESTDGRATATTKSGGASDAGAANATATRP